jgi:hemerythrin-like metal-binding protein
MLKINYPYLDAHKKEHIHFMKELQRIYMEIENKNMSIIFEMIIVLAKWLRHHILITDRRITDFV